MKRIAKLLPDKYFLDKNFYQLRDEMMNEFKKDQKEFDNDIYNMFGAIYPKQIIEEIITLMLGSIRPKYNLKTKKHY